MVSDLIARIQVHVFASLVCLVMLVETQNHRDSKQYSFRLFRAQLIACILLLASEAASWSTIGSAKFFWNTVCFGLHAVPGYLFSLYADHQLGKSEEQLRKHRLLRLLPLLLAQGLVWLNLFVPVLFRIDSNGFYQRETLFFVDMLLSYSYMGYTFTRVWCNQLELDRQFVHPLIWFHVIPLIGGLTQLCFYGSGVTLPSFALALLICYIYIQNRQLGTDYLTNVCNRLQADDQLQRRMERNSRTAFSVMMIDLNHFKAINDQFGHEVGDEALVQSVKLLREVLRKTDTLARYGGDEFLIITDSHSAEEIEQMIKRIHIHFDDYNQQAKQPFQLDFSIGYAIYEPGMSLTPKQLVAKADARMYNNKNEAARTEI